MNIIGRFRLARFLLKGDTYLREKKYEKALQSLDQCELLLKKDYGQVVDEFYDVVIMKAECYLKLQQPQRALIYIKNALGMISRHTRLNIDEKRYLSTYIAGLNGECFNLVLELNGAGYQLSDDDKGVSKLIKLKFPISFKIA